MPPLGDCFLHCEIECVRECCGIDAIAIDSELMTGWAHQVGPEVVSEALLQLADLIAVVEDRSHKLSCLFLNHDTATDEGREELLAFLNAFRSGLRSGA